LMDPFIAAGRGITLTAQPDDSVFSQGHCLTILDHDSGRQADIILEPFEARGLAAWLLAALPTDDASPGRYCAICRHSAGPAPFLMCNHPVAQSIDPVLGQATGKTASFMRAASRACGPAGSLFEPIAPVPAAD
jgi:hypothetical protein